MSKFCFKCGATMEDDVNVCPRCATSHGDNPSFLAEESVPTVQMPDPQSVEQYSASKKSPAKAGRKPVLIGIICAAVFTLILTGTLLFFLLRPDYISQTDNVLYVYHHYLDNYILMYPIYDGKLISEPIKLSKSTHLMPNHDGSAYLDLSENDGKLYLITPQKVQSLFSGVKSARFSKDGKSVYILHNGSPYTLKRYDIDTNSFSIVADGLSTTYFVMDNNQVAYLTQYRQGTSELILTDGITSRKIMDVTGTLLAVSPDCERIFVRERQAAALQFDYVCYRANGDRELLLRSSYIGQTLFNRDYTQMLYNSSSSSSSAGSYICELGKEPVKISDSFVDPVYAHGNENETIRVDNFFGQMYRTKVNQSFGAWIIQADPSQNVQLVESCGFIETDATGEYLYYMVRNGGDREFRIAKISDMADAGKNSVLLTKDTNDFDNDMIPMEYHFTSDGETLYYIFNGSLYSVHGRQGGTPKCIATNLDKKHIRVSANGVVYYRTDGDLYAYDGKETKLVLQDIKNFSFGDYPTAQTADGVYIINDGQDPQLLFTIP